MFCGCYIHILSFTRINFYDFSKRIYLKAIREVRDEELEIKVGKENVEGRIKKHKDSLISAEMQFAFYKTRNSGRISSDERRRGEQEIMLGFAQIFIVMDGDFLFL